MQLLQARKNPRADALLAICGLAFGIMLQIGPILFPLDPLGGAEIALRALIALLGVPLFLFWARSQVRRVVLSLNLDAGLVERYLKIDTVLYGLVLLPLVGRFDFKLTPTVVFFTMLAFVAAQLLTLAIIGGRSLGRHVSTVSVVPVAFHISGFCALTYQVVWQKVLFTEFGVNIESITIVVAIFMLGLGIGALVGGVCSQRYFRKLPHLFMICEVLTGLFGLVSIPLIQTVSHLLPHNSLMTTTAAIFALLFLPTLLMGATLPVLVSYLNRTACNVGRTVGILYFINTLGAAIACFATADVFFTLWGRQATVNIAAAGNLFIGLLIFASTRSLSAATETPAAPSAATPVAASASSPGKERRRLLLVLLLACVTGYISLSQEILWCRAMSYISAGKPSVFAHVLGCFLLGIAFGSLFGKRVAQGDRRNGLAIIAGMLAVSAAVYYFSMPVIAGLLVASPGAGMYGSYLLVGTISFLTGGIFPLLCHYGITSRESVGVPLSWIYFANIVGSTAGPLITGFLLLDTFPLEKNILYLSCFVTIVAAVIFAFAASSGSRKALGAAVSALVVMAMGYFQDPLYGHLLEKLHMKSLYDRYFVYDTVVQNRSGIIAVDNRKPSDVFGGGIYDGKFNTDPCYPGNGITRAFMFAALHPNPADVLEIGLSSGSWAKVISNYRDLRSLTVVEINPGYLEIIARRPEVASILRDPRVQINIDDGRRWLTRYPEKRFDFILMNTTFHWRDGITNLLSAEFLRLCKRHLKEGGVIYYNTTGSGDVVYTAAREFKYVTRYSSFVAASDSPFSMGVEERRTNLLKFEENGRPTFASGSPSWQVMEKMVTSDISDIRKEILKRNGVTFITDDNMATEFKKNMEWSNFVKCLGQRVGLSPDGQL